MNRLYRSIGAALVLVTAACSGTPRHENAPEPAAVSAAIGRVEMTAVAERFEAGGIVRAKMTAVIASRLLAPVVDVKVRPGDMVRPGAVLVLLDARDLRAQRARGVADVAAAQQGVQAAQANRQGAEAALVLARATHTRISTLQAKRSATAQELDEATAALRGAEERAAGARAQVDQAASALSAAQAGSEASGITASYGELTAPFAGVVTERSVDPGSMATPGTPLLVVEDPSAYRVEVRIDEARTAHVKLGDEVDVGLGDSTERENANVKGRVVEIGRTLEPSAHTFLVKVDLPSHPGIRSGWFARVRFAGAARNILTVPSSSVVTRGQLTFIFALDAGRHARLRPIRVGATEGERVAVVAGADAGDAVVLSPAPTLVDGARVTPEGDRR